MNVFSQAVLKGALAPRHLAAGLTLCGDDHVLELKSDKGKVVARYSAIGVHATEILKDADKWLSNKIQYGEEYGGKV